MELKCEDKMVGLISGCLPELSEIEADYMRARRKEGPMPNSNFENENVNGSLPTAAAESIDEPMTTSEMEEVDEPEMGLYDVSLSCRLSSLWQKSVVGRSNV
jgi:hypothetical protein